MQEKRAGDPLSKSFMGVVKRLLLRSRGDTGSLPEYIPDHALTPDMVPDHDCSWQEIARFSLTFSGYSRTDASFNKCTEVSVSRQCTTLSEIRACLSHEVSLIIREQRSPSTKDLEFIHGLLDAMREKIKDHEQSIP